MLDIVAFFLARECKKCHYFPLTKKQWRLEFHHRRPHDTEVCRKLSHFFLTWDIWSTMLKLHETVSTPTSTGSRGVSSDINVQVMICPVVVRSCVISTPTPSSSIPSSRSCCTACSTTIAALIFSCSVLMLTRVCSDIVWLWIARTTCPSWHPLRG